MPIQALGQCQGELEPWCGDQRYRGSAGVGSMVANVLKAEVLKDPHHLFWLEHIAVMMAHGQSNFTLVSLASMASSPVLI